MCQVTNDVALKDRKHSEFYNCAITSKSNNKNGSQKFILEWTSYKMVFEQVSQGKPKQ